MKKIVLAAAIALCFFTNAEAQKDKKYNKIFYTVAPVETDDVTITLVGAVSEESYTKFKLKIKNKTADYIILKPEECKFVINGKDTKTDGKWIVLAPNEDDSKVFDTKGAGYNTLTAYSFVIEGLYKVSGSAKGIETSDFRLPVTKNDFKTGNFTVSLNKLYKQTDATNLKMNVSYNGDKIGFVFPDKAGVKMPDGNEYASVKATGIFAKSSALLLTKGKSDTFTLNWDRMQTKGKAMDMQFAEMLVKWNDAFVEVAPEQLKPVTIQLTIDEALSK